MPVLLQPVLLAGQAGPFESHVALFTPQVLAVVGLELLQPRPEIVRGVVHRFPVRRALHLERPQPLGQVGDVAVPRFDGIHQHHVLGVVDIDRRWIADVEGGRRRGRNRRSSGRGGRLAERHVAEQLALGFLPGGRRVFGLFDFRRRSVKSVEAVHGRRRDAPLNDFLDPLFDAGPHVERLMLIPGVQPLAQPVVDVPLLFHELAADAGGRSTRSRAPAAAFALDPVELLDGLLQLGRERMNQVFLVLQFGRQLGDLQSAFRLVIPVGVDVASLVQPVHVPSLRGPRTEEVHQGP